MTNLYSHQAEYLNEHWRSSRHGLWWEQGTGKTLALIANAEKLYREGLIDGVIIVAAPGGERNWINEQLPEHMSPDIVAVSRSAFWQSPKADTVWHREQMSQLLRHDGLAWYAVTYPAWTTKAQKLFAWKFVQKRRVLFICDEAMSEGAIKTPDGKRSKSIVAAGKHAPFRRIADGTPVAEGPFDAYAPCKFLEPDYWKRQELYPFALYKSHFGKFITREEAMRERGWDPGYAQLVGYRNLDELHDHLKRLGSRVLKSECLNDLPPKVYMPPDRFDMTREQWRLYDEMRDTMFAEWEGGTSSASITLVQLLRFQQIACGYLPNDDEDARLEMIMPPGRNPRLLKMEEIRDQRRGKTIVWTRFRQDVDMVMDLLGERAVRYDGAVSPEDCERAKIDFQQGEAEWFVTTWSKGHTTITLHAAEQWVAYCNSFRLRHRLQGEDRAHRAGLKHTVCYRDIVANDTVDERTIKRLREKNDISVTIMGDDPREWI